MKGRDMWDKVFEEAVAAGKKAAEAVTPTPMAFRNTLTGEVFREDGGACGFAWVTVRPARGPFVTWCKKNEKGSKHWNTGWYFWGSHVWGGQSIERKEAGMKAFAEVLKGYGLNATMGSRLD